jgi:hypothetical protein
VQKVLLLLLGLLREQVVGQAHGDLAGVGQLLDDLVVVGIVLEPPPASITPVTPRRLSSRMKWRVELTW